MKTGFIGTGNMGGALIKGYANSETGGEILIYDNNPTQAAKYECLNHTTIVGSISDLVSSSDIILIAVKPNVFDDILPEIKKYLDSSKIVTSIAAGISIDHLEKQLGKDSKIVRVMPNLNSMLGFGMTALSGNNNVTADDMTEVKKIFTASGKAVEVDESQMDTVVGISGSSPAYAYMYIDSLIEAGVKNGMSREDAKIFACQSTLGAAAMVMESGIEPDVLVENVCSPGGVTIEAVKTLKKNGFKNDVDEAVTAAIAKSKQMTR